jgi:two-component system NarL family sensor kinase
MWRGKQRARVVRFGSRREVAVFVGGGLLVMVVVGLGAMFVCRWVAQQQALADSARTTERLSSLVIGPRLPGYLAQQPQGRAELDRAVAEQIAESNLREVTVWSADGTVLYSDQPDDLGKRFPPSEALLAAAAGTTTAAWEDDPPEADATSAADARASTADDTGPRRFVEVYAPLRLADQPPMVFEAYLNYRQVDDLAGRLLRAILPLVLVPLLLLQLVQIPVGLSLGRRLRRSEAERMRLVQRDLAASDRERGRFAADLHDGPIQELAGSSYALGAVAATVTERHGRLMGGVQDAMLRSIHSLRGLMTDLDRPDLRSGRLDQTISALAEQFRAEGVDVDLQVAELPTLSQEVMVALYRVVRETLANAEQFAAGRVSISVSPAGSGGPGKQSRVRLVIADDGVGLHPSRIDRHSEGYLRVRLLHDRVASLGGELVVTSAPGQGTTVRVELPAQAGATN